MICVKRRHIFVIMKYTIDFFIVYVHEAFFFLMTSLTPPILQFDILTLPYHVRKCVYHLYWFAKGFKAKTFFEGELGGCAPLLPRENDVFIISFCIQEIKGKHEKVKFAGGGRARGAHSPSSTKKYGALEIVLRSGPKYRIHECG